MDSLTDFDAFISPHFQLGEFALWRWSRRFLHQHQADTAQELAQFLEVVRKRVGGRPVRLTSGYRPPAENRAVGGAPNSEHLYAVAREGAVDFWIPGADMLWVWLFCNENWPYSLGDGRARGFIHLGKRADNQRRRWNY